MKKKIKDKKDFTLQIWKPEIFVECSVQRLGEQTCFENIEVAKLNQMLGNIYAEAILQCNKKGVIHVIKAGIRIQQKRF